METKMLKNRFFIVLGLLSLLLVAMAVSRPSPKPASTEDLSWPAGPGIASDDLAIQRGRQADAARWTAMSEYYQKQRSQEAYSARLTAQAGQYQNALAIQKERLADALRRKAIAEFHTLVISAGR
jgi:hypothetical protein